MTNAFSASAFQKSCCNKFHILMVSFSHTTCQKKRKKKNCQDIFWKALFFKGCFDKACCVHEINKPFECKICDNTSSHFTFECLLVSWTDMSSISFLISVVVTEFKFKRFRSIINKQLTSLVIDYDFATLFRTNEVTVDIAQSACTPNWNPLARLRTFKMVRRIIFTLSSAVGT